MSNYHRAHPLTTGEESCNRYILERHDFCGAHPVAWLVSPQGKPSDYGPFCPACRDAELEERRVFMGETWTTTAYLEPEPPW